MLKRMKSYSLETMTMIHSNYKKENPQTQQSNVQRVKTKKRKGE